MSSIETVMNGLFDKEKADLDRLYHLDLETLKEIERRTLIKQAIDFPVKTEEQIKSELDRMKINHINLKWQSISEKLPILSYRYIDWNSFDASNQMDYKGQVDKGDLEKAKKGWAFPVVCGFLAAGSIALICLSSADSPLKKIFAVVSVISVAAGGIATVKMLMSEGPKQEVPASQEKSKSYYKDAIEFAHKENIKILRDWCRQVCDIVSQEIVK